MSGPSQQTQNNQNSITQQDLNISQQQQQQSATEYAQGQALLAPDIARLTSIANGSKSAAFAAEAPVISNITQQQQASAGQISEQLGPGVAKDVALANNITSGGNAIASNLSNAYTSSFGQLAQLGSAAESFSLNNTGAALSGLTGASQSNQVQVQSQTAQKGQTLGFLGELAGAGGQAGAAALGGNSGGGQPAPGSFVPLGTGTVEPAFAGLGS